MRISRSNIQRPLLKDPTALKTGNSNSIYKQSSSARAQTAESRIASITSFLHPGKTKRSWAPLDRGNRTNTSAARVLRRKDPDRTQVAALRINPTNQEDSVLMER